MDPVLLAAGFQGCPIPSRMMAKGADSAVIAELIAARNADPSTFGSTEPVTGPLRLPADFEAKSELHLVFPGWIEHEDLFFEMLEASWTQGQIHVHLMHAEDRSRVRRLAYERGIPTEAVQVHSGWPVESIWIRDFGPLAVESAEGLFLVDWIYALDCMDDDAFPTRLGQAYGRQVVRPRLVVDGGNLSSDGQGTCFTTTALAELNELEHEALAQELARYLGCEQLVALEPLAGNVIDHVDQLLVVAPDGVLLLAMPDPALDSEGYEAMQRNKLRLEHLRRPDGSAWQLLEVPLPPPGFVRAAESSEAPLVVSYLNLLPFNGVVLVPVFGHAESESAALAHIRSAFPGRRVVPVRAEEVARSLGAVHCITLALP